MRNARNLLAYSFISLLILYIAGFKQAGTAETTAVPTQAKSTTPAAAAASKARTQVLPPEQFFGETQAAYEAAKQCPEVCAKLFCYCGCDITDSHASLLDCFTSDHGSDCEVCKGEVFLALGMKNQGKSLAEIQQAVDEKYLSEYPFDSPSANLKKYRATRLWQPATQETKPDPAKRIGPSLPSLKSGKKTGNCCGGKKHPG